MTCIALFHLYIKFIIFGIESGDKILATLFRLRHFTAGNARMYRFCLVCVCVCVCVCPGAEN